MNYARAKMAEEFFRVIATTATTAERKESAYNKAMA